ncbi:MAG: hypothetical protein J1E81_00490 [Eubacterium sp.]|nr:hypothetical protein [Eubacterium sp.]
MAEQIRIDTKYAKRDVTRMNTAIEDLEKVKKQYSNAVANLSSVYKGNASAYLQNQITSVKIKQINSIISSLKTARDQLNIAIKSAEETNEKITKAIKG